jgi:hypothetical protein
MGADVYIRRRPAAFRMLILRTLFVTSLIDKRPVVDRLSGF